MGETSNGTVVISKIVVDSREQGTGTKVMTEITDWADEGGTTLALTPSSDFGGSKTRLVEFYKRFGFVQNKGRNRDFEISEDMYRVPGAPVTASLVASVTSMFTVLVIPEGVFSSDGRSYPPGLLTWRDRYEFMFTDETTEHHQGAFHVGNLDNLRRQFVDGVAWIVGDLTYDGDEEAAEAMRLAQEDKIRRVSADVAQIFEETGVDEFGMPTFELVAAEIVGTTQTPMSAFGDARILTATESMELVPSLLTAALLPTLDASWFNDPELEQPTPLTVTEEGRIYGHLATWGTCHIGFDGVCVTPPTSNQDYGYFHTGAVLDVPVGHITLGTGHAGLSDNAAAASSHYDNTGTCAADIRVGEDHHGIWVAGAARPDADLDALRAASLSGDWRRINGSLELVAALAVNVPGFPIPRIAASAVQDEQLALVAAGMVKPFAPKSDLQLVVEAIEALAAKLPPYEAPDDPDDEIVHGDDPPRYQKLAAVLSA